MGLAGTVARLAQETGVSEGLEKSKFADLKAGHATFGIHKDYDKQNDKHESDKPPGQAKPHQERYDK